MAGGGGNSRAPPPLYETLLTIAHHLATHLMVTPQVESLMNPTSPAEGRS